MYLQNINDIKAVVIMLDGCILDLNKYRYNYYKNMCKQNNFTISKQEFYDNLASQYTMYNNLPLCDKFKPSNLNQTIEDEMYAYLKFKGIYTKEGLFELLDYFKQKDIMVAVMSTHRTKKAVEYLQMTRVFSHVHFIIGSDTKYKPLPSNEMLKAITNQFEITPKELLVISPFLSLNIAANDFGSPVIYYKDLVEPSALERASSIKTVNTFFEILNFLLLEKAYDSNIYSAMLGMSNKMNKDELDQVNNHLKEVYHDDEQILSIVQDTYEYHLSQLNEQYSKKDIPIETDITTENEETKDIEETADVIDEYQEEFTNKIIEKKEDSNDAVIKEEIINQDSQAILSLSKQEELELTSAWNQLMLNEETENIKEDTDEDVINKQKDEKIGVLDYIIYIFTEFIYSLTISFIILAIGIAGTLLMKDFLNNFSPIVTIFNGYLSIVELFISSIMNGLHSILPFIPNYYNFAYNTVSISSDGITLLSILIFNGFIIFIIKMIILLIKKDAVFFEDDE